jgi:hypothetical protein
MKPFAKTALTTDEQVNLLLRRGMKIMQPQRAAQDLQHINHQSTGKSHCLCKVAFSAMGFPAHWKNLSVWQESPLA